MASESKSFERSQWWDQEIRGKLVLVEGKNRECVPTFDEPMLPRELDEYVARELLGWRLTKVGPDASGENECEILTPDGKLPEGIDLPRKGKIGAAYLVPEYSRGLQHAIGLASRFGFKQVTIQTNELSFKIPELIVRCVIGAVSSKTSSRES